MPVAPENRLLRCIVAVLAMLLVGFLTSLPTIYFAFQFAWAANHMRDGREGLGTPYLWIMLAILLLWLAANLFCAWRLGRWALRPRRPA